MDALSSLLAMDTHRHLGKPPTPLATPVRAQAAPIVDSNPLRPRTFDDMIGQARAIGFLRRVVRSAAARDEPLDHMLITGPAGSGKSTVAKIVAHELGVDSFQVEAPVSHETLLDLRLAMNDQDVLFIDEIHQQAIMERRGRSTNTQPEVLYSVMEDRQMVSGTTVLDFPAITVIGATTDEGMLPTSFVDRFPLKPILESYEPQDLARIALANAQQLHLTLDVGAAMQFALAARGVPRQINIYMRNAAALLEPDQIITTAIASEVIGELNHTTPDGLTRDMQRTLTYLLTRCKHVAKATGDVTYSSSVNAIATAIGKGRDTKAIALRVEPYLIEQGYLQVAPRGRVLTDQGVKRARQLIKAGG